MKLFYLDIETTGVKFWRNGIHQISGAIEIDGEVMQRFNYHVKPFDKADIEDEALKVSGVTREDLKDYAEFADVYADIVAMLGQYVDKYKKTDKFFLVGYNSQSFDSPFFRAFFKQNGDEYFGSWFHSVSIDVIVLAMALLAPVRHTMKDFKLMTVARALGIVIEEERLHDAEYDIDITREVYRRVITPYMMFNKFKEGTGTDFAPGILKSDDPEAPKNKG